MTLNYEILGLCHRIKCLFVILFRLFYIDLGFSLLYFLVLCSFWWFRFSFLAVGCVFGCVSGFCGSLGFCFVFVVLRAFPVRCFGCVYRLTCNLFVGLLVMFSLKFCCSFYTFLF